MLLPMMREVRNFFEKSYVSGEFAIQGGMLSLCPGIAGQYIAITGSMLCDGVYLVGANGVFTGTADEQFIGKVWLLSVPRDFVALSEEIATYVQKTPVSAVTSESFGSYSHSMATGKSGGVLSWQEAFADRLRPYRRMFKGVAL